MRIRRLELHNFTNFADQVIDFAGLSLVAIVGKNGAGKTSIIEAILWCLFGRGPKSGARSIDNYIRRGASELRVAVELDLADSVIRVVRHRGRGKTMLEVFNLQGGAWVPMSEQKKADTQETLERLLRLDYQTITASSVILQNESDSLTANMTDIERKDVLANILGLYIWDQLQELARIKARDLKARAKVLTEQVAAAVQKSSRSELVSEQYAEAEAQLVTAEAATATAASTISFLEGELRERPAMQQQVADLTRQVTGLEGDALRLQDDSRQTQRDISEQERLLGRRPNLELQLPNAEQAARVATDLLTNTQVRVSDLEGKVKGFDARVQLVDDLHRQVADKQSELNRITADGASVKSQIDGYASILARASEIRTAATSLSTINADLEKMEASAVRHSELDALCRSLEKTAAEWDLSQTRRVSELESQVRLATGQIEPLGRVPCGDDLRPLCPLLEKAVQAQNGLPSLQDELKVLKAEQNPHAEDWMGAQMDRDEAGYDAGKHRTLQQEGRRLQSAAQELSKLDEVNRIMVDLTARRETLSAQYREAQTSLSELNRRHQEERANLNGLDQLKADLQRVRSEIRSISDGATSAQNRLAGLQQSIQDAEATEPEIQQRIESLKVRAESHIARLTEIEREIKELKSRRSAVETQLSSLDQVAAQLEEARLTMSSAKRVEADLRERLGGLRQELTQLEQLAKEIEELRRKATEAEHKVLVYEVADQVCGKKSGVPALMIEAAVPQIEQLANELLSRMAGGRLRVRLDTQVDGKTTGVAQEVLRITVLDEGAEAPYITFSGAEKFMIDISLRIALSKFLSHRSGAEIGLFVIDEGLGALDDSNRQQVMAAIQESAKEFALVLVITHIPELQDALPQRLVVMRTENGSVVQTEKGSPVPSVA